MKYILVTGCHGQLGSEIQALSSGYEGISLICTDQQDLDIADQRSVEAFFDSQKIDYVVNCAAYTAVDKAETDQETCRLVNVDAVGNLARAAHACGAKMIHVSTDYVYSGESCVPYVELDDLAPQSVYGVTKRMGEELLLNILADSLVIRTSWLYSSYGGNFVKTMINLGRSRAELSVIYDQVGSPTYARDLADVILQIILAKDFLPGIYNFSNEGVCSWYDFALKIHQLSGITSCRIHPIRTAQYPTPAKRPSYSVMDKAKIKSAYGIEIPHWEKSLIDCLKIINNH